MKRIVSLMLFIILVVSYNTALATYNYKDLENKSDIYSIFESSEYNTALIDTSVAFSDSDLSFKHKYSLFTAKSWIRNKIVVMNDNGVRYPIWYTYIYYNGTKPIDVTSITFEIEGETYTFTNLYKKNDIGKGTNNNPLQTITLKHGLDNISFLTAIETHILNCTNNFENIDGLDDFDVKMTLHGNEDIMVQLPPESSLDFFFIEDAFIYDGNTFEYFSHSNNPTPMISSSALREFHEISELPLQMYDISIIVPSWCYLNADYLKQYSDYSSAEVLNFTIKVNENEYKASRITLQDKYAENTTLMSRKSFDMIYSEQLLNNTLKAAGSKDQIRYLNIDDVVFGAYPNVSYDNTTTLIGFTSGIGITVFYDGDINTLESDTGFDMLKVILDELITAFKQL